MSKKNNVLRFPMYLDCESDYVEEDPIFDEDDYTKDCIFCHGIIPGDRVKTCDKCGRTAHMTCTLEYYCYDDDAVPCCFPDDPSRKDTTPTNNARSLTKQGVTLASISQQINVLNYKLSKLNSLESLLKDTRCDINRLKISTDATSKKLLTKAQELCATVEEQIAKICSLEKEISALRKENRILRAADK